MVVDLLPSFNVAASGGVVALLGRVAMVATGCLAHR